MITAKQKVLSPSVDLKQFFEASIGALEAEGMALEISDPTKGRNRPLLQRTQTAGFPARRAMADAARALTAMWRLKPQRG